MASGAEALVGALSELGVRVAFGLPGVHNLAAWDALAASPVRLVGVRHEQAAVYAADGLARTTEGALGVALVTTGPGAANAVAACGEAHACGSPVLVIATDIPTTLRRPGVVRGALHECADQAALFEPVTKATLRAAPATDLRALIHEAATTARTAPSGPVYVEIPTDLLSPTPGPGPPPDKGPGPSPESDLGEGPGPGVDGAGVNDTFGEGPGPLPASGSDPVGVLASASRPLVWAGTGAVHAGARDAVQALAARLGAPVLETYGARGLVDPAHPCWVGLPPHLPEVGALWDEADVVVAIGSDLDGMDTQNWLQPAPPHLVAINVDAADATKNYAADVVVEADARAGAEALAAALGGPDRPSPRPRLDELRARVRARLERSDPEPLAFLDALRAAVDEDVAVFADMCIPGYWLAGMHPFARPCRLAYPVGWGTLGFAFPAALGSALAGHRTLAVAGDGGLLFAVGELATAVQEQAPLTLLVVDDGGYGMLRFDQREAGRAASGVDLHTPDWLALAASFGIAAERTALAAEPGTGTTRAGLAADLRRHLDDPRPTMLVLELAMRPPETTSPRWYRRKAAPLTTPARRAGASRR
jgi:acetolactate synthase-1/2/3 large subunit